MSRRRVAVGAALTGILVLSAVLRRWGWENWSFWLDESLQVFVASHPTREIIALLRNERNHPPLDFLLTHIALKLSTSALFLRWIPTIFSVATSGVLFLRAGGTRRPLPALGAAFAFAVVPFAVHQGQELRAYSLALFFVCIADLARVHHAETGRKSALLACAGASIAAVYSLYIAFFPLVIFWLLDVLEVLRPRGEDRGARLRLLVVPAATILVFVPWFLAVTSNLSRPNELAAQRLTTALLADYAVGFVAGREPGTSRAAAAFVVIATAGVGFAAAGRPERIRLGVELGGIAALTILFLKLTNHWFELRYFWFAMAPFARLVGEGLGGAAGLERFRIPVFAAGSAFLLLVEMPALAENARTGRVDWRIPAGYVAAHAKTGRGGPIVPADWWSYMLLYPQKMRWELPFELAEPCLTSGELESARARFQEGWIARAPGGGTEPDEALKNGPKPWATFDRADGMSLYRFENGDIVPP